VGAFAWKGPGQVCSLPYIQHCIIIWLQLSEVIVQVQTQAQSLFNSSGDTMSKKIKLQDLSIVNFDQQPDVEGIKGGAPTVGCRIRKTPKCYRSKFGTYICKLVETCIF